MKSFKTVFCLFFCLCLLFGPSEATAQAGSEACYANRFEVKVSFTPSAGGESITHTFAAIDDVTVDSTPSATMYLEAGVHYWMKIEYSAPSAPGYQAKLLDIAAPTFSETSGVGTMHHGMSTFKSSYISDYANSGSGTWSVKNDRYGRFEMTVALDGIVSGFTGEARNYKLNVVFKAQGDTEDDASFNKSAGSITMSPSTRHNADQYTYLWTKQGSSTVLSTSRDYSVSNAKVGEVYICTLRRADTSSYNGCTGSAGSWTNTFNICDEPTWTAPTPLNPVYTGGSVQLVEPGTAQNGTMKYWVVPPGGDPMFILPGFFTEDIPMGTEKGRYKIYYMVFGDEGYNDSDYSYVTSNVIEMTNATVSAVPKANDLKYSGAPQALVSAGTANGGTMVYALTGASVTTAPADSAYSATIPTATEVGEYKVWYKVDGDYAHYDTQPIAIPVSIGRKTLTYTVSGTEKVYDGTNGTNVSITLNGVISGETVTLTADSRYCTADAAHADAVNAGSHKIELKNLKLSGADAANYSLQNGGTAYVDGKINPLSVTVTPDADQSKVYGEADPILTYTVTGLLSGDVLEGALTREAGEDVTPGGYIINKGNLSNPNYDITVTDEVFRIRPRTLVISGLSDTTRPYDGTNVVRVDVGQSQLSGFAPGEDAVLTSYHAVTDTPDAGENKAVADYKYVIMGVGDFALSNYTVVKQQVNITITPFDVVVTPDAGQSKIYGSDDPVFAYTHTQLPTKGNALSTQLLTRVNGEDAGSYSYVLDAAALDNNYNITITENADKFVIEPFNISGGNCDVEYIEIEFNGDQIQIDPYVKAAPGGVEIYLIPGVDYTVSGNTATTLGAYTITITGQGNYMGKAYGNWKIVPDTQLLEDVVSGTLTEENVKLSDRGDLAKLLAALESVSDDVSATDEEKADWEKGKELIPALIDKIDAVQKELLSEEVVEAMQTLPENVTADQKDTLETAKEHIEGIIEKYPDNMSEDDIDDLKDGIEYIDNLIAEIEKAESVIKDIEDWLAEKMPTADADQLDMREQLTQIKQEIADLDDNTERIVNEVVAESLAELETVLYTYKITRGNGGRWSKDIGGTLSFTANGFYGPLDSVEPGAYGKFVRLEVNGNKVSERYYTVSAGSTVVTLSEKYLEKLPYGTHSITFVYTDGSTENGYFRTFEVYTPYTGDDSNVGLWMALITLSATTAAAALKYKKKESR